MTAASLDPERVARGFGSVWAGDFRSGVVTRLDPDTRRKQASVQLTLPKPIVLRDPDAPPDSDFLPLDIATGAGGVWVSTARGYVARIDPDTNRVTGYAKTKFDSTGEVAVGDGAVWVGEGNHLGRIDPRALEVSHIELVGPDGLRIGIGRVEHCRNAVRVLGGVRRAVTDETGHRAYQFTKNQQAVAEIDPLTSTVLAVRRVSEPPRSLCNPPVEVAERAPKRVGGCDDSPGYFVPHREDLGPVVRIACVRLPVSAERVDFSLDRANIDSEVESCLTAAYSVGKRQTSVCKLAPPLSEYAVRGVGETRREWGDYAYVIWGTAARSAIQLRYAGGSAYTTVFSNRSVARRFGEQRISIWVAELPLAAACGTVVVRPVYGAPFQRLRPRPAKCQRA